MEHECIGRLAVSKQGRDRGRTFLITGIVDDNHVTLSDGETRKVDRPKKKKLKHLRVLPEKAQEIAAQLNAGKIPQDSDVRKAIEAFRCETSE
ncbi:MAG: KOW domain-containing RNA-binding protein [Clostridia bacterium]|nr:KOW domain-containing RNA-binding protein [Clostridia bacterium]